MYFVVDPDKEVSPQHAALVWKRLWEMRDLAPVSAMLPAAVTSPCPLLPDEAASGVLAVGLVQVPDGGAAAISPEAAREVPAAVREAVCLNAGAALFVAGLADDIAATGSTGTMPAGPCLAGPFFGPDPSPEARAVFADYVRRRWPLRVFALDPVIDEQNVEDSFARRREAQIALAVAFASGRTSAQALNRATRRFSPS